MAQTSQPPSQQHPHQCNPCNLVFDSLKSLEVHHTYNHSKNSSEYPFNRSPAYPGYVLGPGADFPVIPPASSPHSPQPNQPHQNQSYRYHPYNNYPPESPRNNVSSSSPGVNNQPRARGFMCDRCNFIADSQQRLLEHLSVAHAKSPTSNFPFNDCFPPPAAKPPGSGEEILDLDSQKVHVYNPALGEPNEENGINGRNHSVNAMVSSWVNNSHPEKKYYQMSHHNGNLPSPDFPSVSSTTISPPTSESMQQMQSLNSYQPYEQNQQLPSQISSSQTVPNLPTPVPNGKSGKSSGGSWKSNEARRPKTYNCSACNKWFTSSGHLKRHYNTTLHKNAVKQSNQPDPAVLPISVHHHPQKDPTFAAGLQGSAPSPPPPSSRSANEEGGSTPAPLHSTKTECESPIPINNANNSRNVTSPTNYNNYPNFLSNSPNLMAGPSEHQSGGLLLSHPHLPQINSHLSPMSPHLPPSINSHLPPINSHLSSISPHQYPPHPPQYHPTSNIHLIQSTSPAAAMPTPQFMALAPSQGIPPSGSPGGMAMNYPNLQPPHVSSTQAITTNSNFGNSNSEGVQPYQSGEHPNDAYYPAHGFGHFQNVAFNQIVEPDYYNSSQGIEDVGGQVRPLSAESKAQSPHNESYSMETFTKIGNSPTSNGVGADSRSDSGLETSPSPLDPLDIKKEYAYLSNYEESKPDVKKEYAYLSNYEESKLDIKKEYAYPSNYEESKPEIITGDFDVNRVKKENNIGFLINTEPPQFSDDVADSSQRKVKPKPPVKKRNTSSKDFDEKNQVSSSLDSFPRAGADSPKVENKVIHRCDECDKIFNRSCYLTQHNKSFHSGVEKPYKCYRCGKRFVAESLHREHFSKHGGDKPFKCDMCPKQFNHKTDLRRHMCLHSGEKPFSCDVCGKGFIRKDHMLKHTETHRRKYKEPPVFSSTPPKILS
ncbi:unnamed protein product [Bemisia tabaci]|uniref:C2H2-type domain-containing protein n=1 Tax=Bemisia tabaci TaxID=7038 RepID=A0A9P0A0U2_BEMTA|nr:unnamed protein product [Bemisia tabaci]